jgi:hypothetical protein
MKRYKHKLSHFRNTTMNMGQLVPIGCVDVVHGDTFKHNTSMFMRVAPLANPIMHPVHAQIHHYYVPYRVLWEDWESFITGGEDLDDESVVPKIDTTGDPVEAGDLLNHLGVPVGYEGKIDAFYARAYALIWNEFYRDDQLQDKISVSLAGGADTTTATALKNVNWQKDYFTSARPDDQLGEDVTIPLAGDAPIKGIGTANTVTSGGADDIYETGGVMTNYTDTKTSASHALKYALDANGYPNITADLAGVSGVTLDQLRLAIATQRHQEMINRTGNEYTDYLRRYGISYSDSRLQRPEYLGGGKQTVQFSEVLQNAPNADGNGVGDLFGHGIAALRSNNYMKYFEEPGVIISLMHVRPISMYMQGLHKMFSRTTKEDFYQKEYEILPMQEIKNKEIKHDHTSPDGTFGYQARFDQYRSIPNSVHGEFTTVLKDWHMARELSGDPALNDSLITCNPTDRIYQSSANDQLYLTIQHKLIARRFVKPRSMPTKGLIV